MTRHMVYFSLLVMFLAITGCESYDFTVNDKLVYTPKQLFNDFDTPDAALYECIKQAIIDSNASSASELGSLNCTHAGIENLEGLATFTGLIQLKLSSNKIRNLSQIGALQHLQELYLDDNVVVDPVPLYPLRALRILNLGSNPLLQCPAGSPFAELESIELPDHCH